MRPALLEPDAVASLVSNETNFPFVGTGGLDHEGQKWIRLVPDGLDSKQTFGIRLTLSWRRLEIAFEPGVFAAGLLEEMGKTDVEGRAVFGALLSDSRAQGADVRLRINARDCDWTDPGIWIEPWSRLELVLRKGNIELGDLDADPSIKIVRDWILRFSAAVVSILPLEEGTKEQVPDNQNGFPEGASTTVVINRYERDRRNRAAAIAIHGTRCKGCGMSFEERYGAIGLGFIEIHHVVPVSKLGPDYIIDPALDLVPLCSNCHSIAHRRDPPLNVEELKALLYSV